MDGFGAGKERADHRCQRHKACLGPWEEQRLERHCTVCALHHQGFSQRVCDTYTILELLVTESGGHRERRTGQCQVYRCPSMYRTYFSYLQVPNFRDHVYEKTCPVHRAVPVHALMRLAREVRSEVGGRPVFPLCALCFARHKLMQVLHAAG